MFLVKCKFEPISEVFDDYLNIGKILKQHLLENSSRIKIKETKLGHVLHREKIKNKAKTKNARLSPKRDYRATHLSANSKFCK